MKLIFTFFLFLLVATTNAADARVDSLPVRSPLYIIDGKLADLEQLQELDPSNIVSVDILKELSTPKIYCGNYPGIIIISTRSTLVKTFMIKDFLTGDNIPLATAYFITGTDTIKAIADDNGLLRMNKLKPSVQYEMMVSSAGYKTLKTVTKGKEQEILLEKDVKECGEVIVSASVCTRICRYFCRVTKTTKCEIRTASSSKEDVLTSSVYPNPVQRGQFFNLEYNAGQVGSLQLSIIALNGKLVKLESKKTIKGLNRFSINADNRWAAGIYIVQLRNEAGDLVKNEKLVIQ